MARSPQPDDPDLAAAKAIRDNDEKAFTEATKGHSEVIYVSPDGVERVAYTPSEQVALAFAGWSEKKTSSKKEAS